MFQNHIPLHKQEHQQLGLVRQSSFGFAAREQLIPIVASEAQAAADEFVIVFPRSAGGLPQLVTGLGDGVNAYVGADGRWLATLVPAQVASYPFLLAEHAAEQNKSEVKRGFTVRVVPDAPHLASGQGEPLLDEAGEPTALLLKVQQSLAAVQAEAEHTQFLVQAIQDAGLLVEAVLPVQPPQGPAIGLQGLRVVDKAKFDALSPEVVLKLRESGALALVQAHVLSLKNLHDSTLARAATREAGAASPADLMAALAEAAQDKGQPMASAKPGMAKLLATMKKM